MFLLLQNLIVCHEISVHSTNSLFAMKCFVYCRISSVVMKSQSTQQTLPFAMKCSVCRISVVVMKSTQLKLPSSYEMLRLLQNLIGCNEISVHSTNSLVAMKFSVYSKISSVVMKSQSTQQTHWLLWNDSVYCRNSIGCYEISVYSTNSLFAMKCSFYCRISLFVMKSPST